MKRLIFWFGFWCAVSGVIVSMSVSFIYLLSMVFGIAPPNNIQAFIPGGVVVGAFGLIVLILCGGWQHGE